MKVQHAKEKSSPDNRYLCGKCNAPLDSRRVEDPRPPFRQFFCQEKCRDESRDILGPSRFNAFVKSMDSIIETVPPEVPKIHDHIGRHRPMEFPAEMHFAIRAAAARRGHRGKVFGLVREMDSDSHQPKSTFIQRRDVLLVPFSDFEADEERKRCKAAGDRQNESEANRLKMKQLIRTARQIEAHRVAMNSELAESTKRGDAVGQEFARRQLAMIEEVKAESARSGHRRK